MTRIYSLSELEEKYLGKTIETKGFEGKWFCGTCNYIDAYGRLFGTWGNFPLVPDADSFSVLTEEERKIRCGENA